VSFEQLTDLLMQNTHWNQEQTSTYLSSVRELLPTPMLIKIFDHLDIAGHDARKHWIKAALLKHTSVHWILPPEIKTNDIALWPLCSNIQVFFEHCHQKSKQLRWVLATLLVLVPVFTIDSTKGQTTGA
jgi:hypothetical protein